MGWRTWLLGVGRALIGLAIVMAAAWVGLQLGRVLREVLPYQPVAILGGALILTTIREGLPELYKFGMYVRTGQAEPLYGCASFLLIAAATVVASSLPPDQDSAVVPQSSVVFFDRANSSQPGPSQEFTMSVPFFKEAESCDPKTEWGGGTTLDGSSKTFLQNLASGLLHCADQGKAVDVIVRGFASSSKLKGDLCSSDPEKANRDVANARARAVAEILAGPEAAAKESETSTLPRVNVSVETWTSPTAMRDKIHFSDMNSRGEFSELRGNLTRRADVIVKNAGDCQITTSRSDWGSPGIGN